MKTQTTEKNHAIENAQAWLKTIMELTAKLNTSDRDSAEQEILESALEVSMRSGWVSNKEEMQPEEFLILLSTGGPALRIVGDISQGQPERSRLQWQDWGTPWTNTETSAEEDEAIEKFVNCFYLGE